MKKLLISMLSFLFVFGTVTLIGTPAAKAEPVPEDAWKSYIYDETCDHSWEKNEDFFSWSVDGEKVKYDCVICGSYYILQTEHSCAKTDFYTQEDGEYYVYSCQTERCYYTYTVKKAHSFKSFVQKASASNTTGCSGKKCTKCGYTIYDKTWYYNISGITLSKSSYSYTGKQRKPTVTLKDYSGNKISKSYYTVTYKNNINPGTATVIVKLKGRYAGTLKETFKILPAKATLKSVSYSGKARMTVRWKKLKGVSGYAIQYSTSKSFASGYTCTVFVNYKYTSKTIKTLAKTTYYVRVCGYKNFSGSKYGGTFSAKKVVKIRSGATMKQMINAIKSTTKYYKQIKSLTNNKVDIRKYKSTYARIRALYTWHAKNSSKFVHCLACNYNFAECIYYLTYGSKSYDSWIRIACDRYKNNSGSVVQHKWCVLMLQGTKYIFDPRMQGNLGQSSGFSHFGFTYGSSVGKHYLYDGWYTYF